MAKAVSFPSPTSTSWRGQYSPDLPRPRAAVPDAVAQTVAEACVLPPLAGRSTATVSLHQTSNNQDVSFHNRYIWGDAVGQGYALPWQVWDRYEVTEAGFIRPAGSGPQWYDAGWVRNLPVELARAVTRPDGRRRGVRIEARVVGLLDFMRRFGSLGQTVLEGQPRRLGGNADVELVDGDDLAWALGHAEASPVASGSSTSPDSREMRTR